MSDIGGGLGGLVARIGLDTSPLALAAGRAKAEFSGLATHAGQSIDRLSSQTTQKLAGIGARVGVTIAGLGALMEHMARPLEQAQAALKTSLDNVGASFEDLKGPIDHAVSRMEKFGFMGDDTMRALAKMTEATKSYETALAYLGPIADIAAFQQIKLADAANLVVKGAAGSFKGFKALGENIKGTADAAKMAERAEHEHAAAVEQLGTATQRLADFEERAADRRAQAQQRYADKAAAAQEKVAGAVQSLADTEQNASDTRDQINASNTDAKDRWTESYEKSNERVALSEQKLGDLQLSIAARLADERHRYAEEQWTAEQRLAAAKQHLAELAERQGAAGDPRRQAEISAAQELKHAHQALESAQDGVNYTAAKGADVGKQSVEQTRQLEGASREVSAAKEENNKLATDGLKVGQLTLAQNRQLEASTRAVEDAQTALGKAQEEQAKVEQDRYSESVAMMQEERNLRDGVAKARDKEVEASAKVNDARNAEADNMKKLDEGIVESQKRVGGAAKERADTVSGWLDAEFAKLKDVVARMGAEWAGMALVGGVALSGLSTAVGVFSAVIGALSIEMIVAFGGIALIIAGAIAIGILLVTHWDGIKEKLVSAWNWIKDKASEIWDGITNKFDKVIDFFTGLPGRIRSAASGMWDGIKDAFKDVVNFIIRMWNSLQFKLPSFAGLDVAGHTVIPGWTGPTLGVPKIDEIHHSGGKVGGGSSEVLALLEKGEGVLSRRAMAQLDKAMGSLGGMNLSSVNTGALQSAGGPSQNINLNVNVPEGDMWARAVAREIEWYSLTTRPGS